MGTEVRAFSDRPDAVRTPNAADDSAAAAGLFGIDVWWWARRERPWREAECLLILLAQVNQLAPARSTHLDGQIGDVKHRRRASDHNPNIVDAGFGVVSALDITHDAVRGCDADVIAESLRESRDPRLKYVIWNRRIFSSLIHPWMWRDYDGENEHASHIHVSVLESKELYDSTQRWNVSVS